MSDEGTNVLETRCVISGGGPAGIMLGYLLARAGIDVAVLEKWPDFFRDFRGDTIHPSTMELLKELGLLEKFLAIPHNETRQVAADIGGEEIVLADFAKIPGPCPFIAFMPQWDFLNFISEEARQYPSFHLLMETEVTGLVEEDGKIRGLRAKGKDGEFEIRAELTIGADGRHSMVREASGLPLRDLGAPIDVLWFSLPREDDGTERSLGFVDRGRMMVLLDRDSYWQCAFIIPKGGFEKLKADGIEAFRDDVAALVPLLAGVTAEIDTWEKVKLLSVAVDHLDRWWKPGMIAIGDAAHAMSPVGGVGINLAVQDAVAAANILIPAFGRKGGVTDADLAAIEKRRTFPARMIQRVQVYLHTHLIERIIESTGHARVPWQLRVISLMPVLRRVPAYLIGIGIRPEHIRR